MFRWGPACLGDHKGWELRDCAKLFSQLSSSAGRKEARRRARARPRAAVDDEQMEMRFSSYVRVLFNLHNRLLGSRKIQAHLIDSRSLVPCLIDYILPIISQRRGGFGKPFCAIKPPPGWAKKAEGSVPDAMPVHVKAVSREQEPRMAEEDPHSSPRRQWRRRAVPAFRASVG